MQKFMYEFYAKHGSKMTNKERKTFCHTRWTLAENSQMLYEEDWFSGTLTISTRRQQSAAQARQDELDQTAKSASEH